MNLFTESQKASLSKPISILMNRISEVVIKASTLIAGSIEKYNIKENIKEMEKMKLVSSPSTIKNFGVKRYKKYEKEFAKYIDEIVNRCLVFSRLSEERQSENYSLYEREIVKETDKFQKKLKEIYKESISVSKKLNISKETVEELKIEVEMFMLNIKNLGEQGMDGIRCIEGIEKTSDNRDVINLCMKVCNKLVVCTQRLVTDYIVYPNHLIQVFKSINHIGEKKGS